MLTSFTKAVFILIWLAVIITPPALFVSVRGGLPAEPLQLFPVFGLLALTMVWAQIMLGSFMVPLEKHFPNAFKLHIGQGILALLFAVLHPLLLIIGATPAVYAVYGFVDPALKSYVFLGQGALLLLILGIAAGLLRKWPPIKRIWHWLHLVNYLVFILAFVHSWNLGTDLSISYVLNGIWIFMLVTVIIGFLYRRIYIPSKQGLVASTS
jgi:predicted ferric reductase